MRKFLSPLLYPAMSIAAILLSAGMAIVLFVPHSAPDPAVAVTIASLSRSGVRVQHTLRDHKTYSLLLTVNVTGSSIDDPSVLIDGGRRFLVKGFGHRLTDAPYAWSYGPLTHGSIAPYVFLLHTTGRGPVTIRASVFTDRNLKTLAETVVWTGSIR